MPSHPMTILTGQMRVMLVQAIPLMHPLLTWQMRHTVIDLSVQTLGLRSRRDQPLMVLPFQSRRTVLLGVRLMDWCNSHSEARQLEPTRQVSAHGRPRLMPWFPMERPPIPGVGRKLLQQASMIARLVYCSQFSPPLPTLIY